MAGRFLLIDGRLVFADSVDGRDVWAWTGLRSDMGWIDWSIRFVCLGCHGLRIMPSVWGTGG